MPFLNLVPEEQLSPDAKAYIDRAKKRQRSERISPGYYLMANHPPVLKAFVEAFDTLVPVPNRFGTSQFIASMLIAHDKHCGPCFDASRIFLAKIGMNEQELDRMCELPSNLPLSERDRCFVEFTLRVAREPAALKAADFEELARAGFTRDEIVEMIGVAGFWALATTVTTALDKAFRAE
jgi:alkylhydroperoxidase family enzyme